MRLLIVDNDIDVCDLIREYYINEGNEVRVADNGTDGVGIFKTFRPDLVFLEVMLPEKDGWQVCREIREMSSKPIIFVTERGDIFDRVLGFGLGADDYIVKPFDIRELSARAKAVLRRCDNSEKQDDEVVKYENIEISLRNRDLKIRGKSVPIPPKEFELLYYLALNAGRAFTRDQLLDRIWGFDYLGDSRTIDVHIKRLRERIGGVSDKWCIKTVFGVGYKFELLA